MNAPCGTDTRRDVRLCLAINFNDLRRKGHDARSIRCHKSKAWRPENWQRARMVLLLGHYAKGFSSWVNCPAARRIRYSGLIIMAHRTLFAVLQGEECPRNELAWLTIHSTRLPTSWESKTMSTLPSLLSRLSVMRVRLYPVSHETWR